MVQGINREYIFQNNKLKKKYLDFFNDSIKEKSIKLIAYCAMDNHIHMLIFADMISDLSKTMSSVNTKYARYYNKEMNRCGYVFRDRYKSEIIIDRSHLENCIKYIHNNPVKANICKNPSEYEFSSYNDFLKYKVDKDIINLLCDGSIRNINRLLKEDVCYEFIDIVENLEYERKENVLNEYKNYEYMNKNDIYYIINDIKKRCNISNEEIANFLGIKKTTFYKILKNHGE